MDFLVVTVDGKDYLLEENSPAHEAAKRLGYKIRKME